MEKSITLKITAPLTKREKEIWVYLLGYFADHGYSPTTSEIGDYLKVRQETAWAMVANMTKKGWIAKSPNISSLGRTIIDPALYEWKVPNKKKYFDLIKATE